MGNRAVIIFHNEDNTEYSPQIYVHWAPANLPDLFKQLTLLMTDRTNDPSYAAARFTGILHNALPGNLSLGLFNLPEDFQDEAAYISTRISHGDEGVFLINTSNFSIRRFE